MNSTDILVQAMLDGYITQDWLIEEQVKRLTNAPAPQCMAEASKQVNMVDRSIARYVIDKFYSGDTNGQRQTIQGSDGCD